MKEKTMKKLTGVIGFLVIMLVFAIVPGTKADAATLKNGNSEAISANLAGGGDFHTLKLTKDSWVKFTLVSNYKEDTRMSDGYITIYKGSKRVSLQKAVSYYGNGSSDQWAAFALKKGTYRVHVQMVYKGFYDANYNVQPNVYKVRTSIATKTDGGGNTKGKAVTLKNNKYKSGIVAVTETSNTKGDWYKFKLTKTRKVKLTFTGQGEGIGISYQTSKIPISYHNNVRNFFKGKAVKLPKGTYWFKITKSNSLYSGYYKVKIKY